MKKYLFLFLLAFLLGASSGIFAQSKIGLGIKGGINISDQVTSGTGEGVNVKSIVRYNAGAYFNFFLLDKLAIQPELLVSGKGSDWNDPAYDVKDLLTYIDIPILVRYQLFDLLNIHAGPQFGYLLSAQQKDNSTGDMIDINDYYEKSDLGIVIGTEVNLPFRVNITVRYVIGLIGTTTDVEYVESWLNNFFQISAGFRFMGK